MPQPMTEDLAEQIVRAYLTFGIDPTDGVDEFGIWGKLDPRFLSEKAKKQLRDIQGRFREMRARMNKGNEPVHIAAMRDVPEVPKPRISREELTKHRDSPTFEEPGEYGSETVDGLKEHIARRDRERARLEYKIEDWEAGGRQGPRPEPSAWLQKYEEYESVGKDGQTPAPPEERLAHKIASRAMWRWREKYRGAMFDPQWDELGGTASPTVLGHDEFGKFEGLDLGWHDPLLGPEGKGVLHRGVTGGVDQPVQDTITSTLKAPPEEFRPGTGKVGDGLYFGDLKTATAYAGLFGTRNADEADKADNRWLTMVAGELPDLAIPRGATEPPHPKYEGTIHSGIMRSKLQPDAKIIDADELNRLMDEEFLAATGQKRSDLNPLLQQVLAKEHGLEPAMHFWALKHGYDAISSQQFGTPGIGILNVVNRGKLVFEDNGLPYTPPPPKPPDPGPEPVAPVPLRKRKK